MMLIHVFSGRATVNGLWIGIGKCVGINGLIHVQAGADRCKKPPPEGGGL